MMEDAKELQMLNEAELGYVYSLEKTYSQLSSIMCKPTDKIFVAVLDEHVVGYIHANHYALLYADAMMNIMGIAVIITYNDNYCYTTHGQGGAMGKRQ